MGKILLLNPPGPRFQRGEDRCQADIDHSSATSLRPPNNLAYLSALLRKNSHTTIIKDYPAQNSDFAILLSDISTFLPDIIIVSTTEPTLYHDLNIIAKIKEANSQIKIIYTGAFFRYNTNESLYEEIEGFQNVDFIIYGENESVICILANSILTSSEFSSIKGIHYNIKYNTHKNSENSIRFIKTKPSSFITNLDDLPFPDRDNLQNNLYIDPLSNKPIATIEVARGCPSKCIYCLAPVISGSKVRIRSTKNVIEEIKEVKNKYDIDHFFFRADTFSINNKWVRQLTDSIILEKLNIKWVANARIDSVTLDLLKRMKKAGCYLIAFGIESGSDETLKKTQKGYTSDRARQVIAYAKKAGLDIFGFFMIGFPWETKKHILETKKFILKNSCDYIEVHIATPYIGTKLYENVKKMNLLDHIPIGNSYFNIPSVPTKHLTVEQIKILQQNIIRSFYLRPSYIIRKVIGIRSLGTLKNYWIYGIKLLKNLVVK